MRQWIGRAEHPKQKGTFYTVWETTTEKSTYWEIEKFFIDIPEGESTKAELRVARYYVRRDECLDCGKKRWRCQCDGAFFYGRCRHIDMVKVLSQTARDMIEVGTSSERGPL